MRDEIRLIFGKDGKARVYDDTYDVIIHCESEEEQKTARERLASMTWIPCSERLPEEDEDIIVTYVDDEETRIIPVNYGKGTWYDCIFDTALNPIKVIAWMPLPDPYREE